MSEIRYQTSGPQLVTPMHSTSTRAFADSAVTATALRAGFASAKVRGVDLVEVLKLLDVDEKHGALDDAVERRAVAFERVLHVVERLSRLRLDAAGDELAGGVRPDLTRYKKQVVVRGPPARTQPVVAVMDRIRPRRPASVRMRQRRGGRSERQVSNAWVGREGVRGSCVGSAALARPLGVRRQTP